jgi:hypothetical protein
VFSGAASGYIILADYARGQQPTNVVGSSVNVSSLNNLPSPDSLAQNSKVFTLNGFQCSSVCGVPVRWHKTAVTPARNITVGFKLAILRSFINFIHDLQLGAGSSFKD